MSGMGSSWGLARPTPSALKHREGRASQSRRRGGQGQIMGRNQCMKSILSSGWKTFPSHPAARQAALEKGFILGMRTSSSLRALNTQCLP